MACRLYTPVPTEAFLLTKREKKDCLDIVCVQLPTQISTLLYVYTQTSPKPSSSLASAFLPFLSVYVVNTRKRSLPSRICQRATRHAISTREKMTNLQGMGVKLYNRKIMFTVIKTVSMGCAWFCSQRWWWHDFLFCFVLFYYWHRLAPLCTF
jgi:hypothetical protein